VSWAERLKAYRLVTFAQVSVRATSGGSGNSTGGLLLGAAAVRPGDDGYYSSDEVVSMPRERMLEMKASSSGVGQLEVEFAEYFSRHWDPERKRGPAPAVVMRSTADCAIEVRITCVFRCRGKVSDL
jgi:hypothetical protein